MEKTLVVYKDPIDINAHWVGYVLIEQGSNVAYAACAYSREALPKDLPLDKAVIPIKEAKRLFDFRKVSEYPTENIFL